MVSAFMKNCGTGEGKHPLSPSLLSLFYFSLSFSLFKTPSPSPSPLSLFPLPSSPFPLPPSPFPLPPSPFSPPYSRSGADTNAACSLAHSFVCLSESLSQNCETKYVIFDPPVKAGKSKTVSFLLFFVCFVILLFVLLFVCFDLYSYFCV